MKPDLPLCEVGCAVRDAAAGLWAGCAEMVVAAVLVSVADDVDRLEPDVHTAKTACDPMAQTLVSLIVFDSLRVCGGTSLADGA
jgi:hypothetical protein